MEQMALAGSVPPHTHMRVFVFVTRPLSLFCVFVRGHGTMRESLCPGGFSPAERCSAVWRSAKDLK